MVAAASPEVPEPLLEQLAEGGRLVMPLERGGGQALVKITRAGHSLREETLGNAQFVPLIGRHGHTSEPS